jgi:hypothetical protein
MHRMEIVASRRRFAAAAPIVFQALVATLHD